MSNTRKIPRDELDGYFNAFTRKFLSDQSPESINVELLAPDWGDQFVAEGVRLLGITYDSHDNALEFELPGGDHRVIDPREVWAVEEPDGFVSAVQVIRADGTRDVARVQRADSRSDERGRS